MRLLNEVTPCHPVPYLVLVDGADGTLLSHVVCQRRGRLTKITVWPHAHDDKLREYLWKQSLDVWTHGERSTALVEAIITFRRRNPTARTSIEAVYQELARAMRD